MAQSNFTQGRRNFLKQLRNSSAGLMLGASLAPYAQAAESNNPPPCASSANQLIDFYGKHQAGITSPVQKHIFFVVLDLHSTERDKIKAMFQQWTTFAALLTQGNNSRAYGSNAYVPPADTGEADSLGAHRLTLTFGVSPSFFSKLGIDSLRPAALQDLPHFPRDQLKAPYIGGDICIQACADDPQVAFHAVRNLVRAARLNITMRWGQMGFNSFDSGSDTPRNLFAFKDGTANLTGEDLDKVVWVEEDGWLKGGSYLIARRVKMFTETWDRTSLAEQNNTFGRLRDSGAAFGQQAEHDPVQLTNDSGAAILPENSHVHLAHATGRQILRRSFSFVNGIDDHAQFDTGLLFISYQSNPQAFIDIQKAFGNVDKLNEYITHTGSGIFACFAGVENEQDYLGRALFTQI